MLAEVLRSCHIGFIVISSFRLVNIVYVYILSYFMKVKLFISVLVLFALFYFVYVWQTLPPFYFQTVSWGSYNPLRTV